MKISNWILLRKLSLIYLSALALLFIASLLVLGLGEEGRKPANFVGCYSYDALLVGFECSGFPLENIMTFMLNFPLYHFYMPFFIIWNPLLIFAAVVMYFPFILLLVAQSKIDSKGL